MPKSQPVKAAVLERSRRSTAGKRMASLVGKAQDDDETFWTHSIWSEMGGGFSDGKSRKRRRDDDSSSSTSEDDNGDGDESMSDGEGSFRMSDEESAAGVDQFDSDFDESETDDDGGDDGEGGEEKELRAQERRDKASKRKKNQRLGVPLKSGSAGRALVKGKVGKMTKRGPMGEGWNEGVVLNWPPPTAMGPTTATMGHTTVAGTKPAGLGPTSQPCASAAQSSIPSQTLSQPQQTSQPSLIETHQIATKLPPTAITAANLQTGEPAIPAAVSASPLAKPTHKPKPERKSNAQTKMEERAAATSERKQSTRRHFTQEELILESIKSTEIDNQKWINGRKRSKEEAAQLEKATIAKKSSLNSTKPLSRFHSKRGRNNTLTFMDMDHLPEILTRRQTTAILSSRRSSSTTSPKRRRLNGETSTSVAQAASSSTVETMKKEKQCFITGKTAKYRDPKTKLYYHDANAFKEIRRRLAAGEIKIAPPTPSIRKSNTAKKKSSNETVGDMSSSNDNKTAVKRKKGGKASTMVAERVSRQSGALAAQIKWYTTQDNETPRMVAKKLQLNLSKLVKANKKRYPTLLAHSKLMAGTSIQISHLDLKTEDGPKKCKVTVTQGGIPVSPPSKADIKQKPRIHIKLPPPKAESQDDGVKSPQNVPFLAPQKVPRFSRIKTTKVGTDTVVNGNKEENDDEPKQIDSVVEDGKTNKKDVEEPQVAKSESKVDGTSTEALDNDNKEKDTEEEPQIVTDNRADEKQPVERPTIEAN